MWKFGITDKSLIPTDWPDVRRPPAIALTLLEEFAAPLSSEDEHRLSLIYRTIFGAAYSRMITFAGRFRSIDEAIEEEATKAFNGSHVRVAELAASNAVTSLDLFERLRTRFSSLIFRATDRADALYAVPVGKWTVVFDADKQPMQFIGRRFVISAVKERKRYPVNRLLREWLIANVLPKAIERRGSARRISLVHPRCNDAGEGFSVGREDAFAPSEAPCDLLRVMNLSNLILANDPMRALAAISRNVVEGGLLVLGDTPDEKPAGTTIFRRVGPGFTALRDIVGPYALKEFVLRL